MGGSRARPSSPRVASDRMRSVTVPTSPPPGAMPLLPPPPPAPPRRATPPPAPPEVSSWMSRRMPLLDLLKQVWTRRTRIQKARTW
eukprot:365670-Chlamydomonas_euryale.AAC.4